MEHQHEVMVLVEDVRTALDALDNVEGVEDQDWYQRLEQAADLATKEFALKNRWIRRN